MPWLPEHLKPKAREVMELTGNSLLCHDNMACQDVRACMLTMRQAIKQSCVKSKPLLPVHSQPKHNISNKTNSRFMEILCAYRSDLSRSPEH